MFRRIENQFDIAVKQPNKETVAAMLEAERILKDPSVKGYDNLKAYSKIHRQI